MSIHANATSGATVFPEIVPIDCGGGKVLLLSWLGVQRFAVFHDGCGLAGGDMLGPGSGSRGLVGGSVLHSDVPGTGSVSRRPADGGTLKTEDRGSGLSVCRDGPPPPTTALVVFAPLGVWVFWTVVSAGMFLDFFGRFFGRFGVECVGLAVLFPGLFWGVPGAPAVVGIGA